MFTVSIEVPVVTEWILSLAAEGGAALIGAAATDAWQSARSSIVKLFDRTGSRRQKLIEAWLDDDAMALERAEPAERSQLRSELAATWQQRLADLLAEFPEVREELEAWADHVRRDLPAAEQSWVQKNVAGRDAYVVQHGNQYFYRAGKSPNGGMSTLAGPE
jgi:hypothetical protein